MLILLFFFGLVLSHTCWCSMLTPSPANRDYSWWVWGIIWTSRDRILISYMQERCPTCCSITLAPLMLLDYWNILHFFKFKDMNLMPFSTLFPSPINFAFLNITSHLNGLWQSNMLLYFSYTCLFYPSQLNFQSSKESIIIHNIDTYIVLGSSLSLLWI